MIERLEALLRIMTYTAFAVALLLITDGIFRLSFTDVLAPPAAAEPEKGETNGDS